MEVHEDFTSKKLSLVFDSGKIIPFTREESIEFERWFLEKCKEKEQSDG